MPKLSPFRILPVRPSSDESGENAHETHGFLRKLHIFHPLSEKNDRSSTPERRGLRPLQMRRNQQQQQQGEETGSDNSGEQTPTRGGGGAMRFNSVQNGGNKHGGSSQFATPRSAKIENRYSLMHSEPGTNMPQSGTGKKSVSRSLKYTQDRNVNGNSSALGFKQGGDSSGAVVQFELEEDLNFWQDHNVQVLIRIRPVSSLELSLQGPGKCLRQDTSHSLTWSGHPESRFTFDHVACEAISQEKLFRVAGLPMVENCISGYNSCMFAYGQTGSGKTHTMLGEIADVGQEQGDGRGMIPRVFEYLFVKIQKEEEARKPEHLQFVCKCSFLEIYNEQISDLLEPSSTNLQLREDVKKGVYVENLSEIEVRSVHDVIKLLLQGSANRKVAATNMNRESSRSHSVFTCVVESKWESDAVINTRFGRLNLVDLAGSERQKSSGAEGDRLKEAANINKSLSTLGLVIMVLVDAANGKPRHVPYRDSKLTFLLQDSLGGNSKTMIIATVSPSSSCSLETLSTLKFAQRAKFIRNNAIVNEDTFGDVASLRQQIQLLKEEINHLRNQQLRRSREENASILDRLGQDVLAASLRRETAAESVIKNLGVEIGQLKRLVRQREEDTQRVKMLLRFREDKIRRLEAMTTGSLDENGFQVEERDSLREEIKLLGCRVEHNPEVTRFAMENIRLMDELKRFQDFYDHGERETMSTEISSLRDQLVEILEANAALKDECGVPSHSELSEHNEKLNTEKAVTMKENEALVQKLELSKANVEELLRDQEAQMCTISGLKLLIEQCEETSVRDKEENLRLETQLRETKKELGDLQLKYKEANEVQEQMESQQLILINELEAALLKQQEASDSYALKTQLQSLQLELQKKDQIRSLEKEFETAQYNSNEIEKQRVEGELLKTRQELEDAQELNRLFFRDKVQRVSLEKHMDVTRAEAEAETADVIASMQAELLTTREKLQLASDLEKKATENAARLVEDIRTLQLENERLTDLCSSLGKDRDTEADELRKAWEQATGRLVSYLSEGDETLHAAAKEMEDILQVPSDSPSAHFAPKLAEKAIGVLQLKLQQAFNVVKDAELKVRVLNEATMEMSELQKKQTEEVEKAKTTASEAESRAVFLDTRLSLSESRLTKSDKAMEVAAVVLAHLTENQTRLREIIEVEMQRRRTGDEAVSSLMCDFKQSETKADAALLVIKHCAELETQLKVEIDDQKYVISVLEEKNLKLLHESELRLQTALEELIVQDVILGANSSVCSKLQEAVAEKNELLEEVQSLRLESKAVMTNCASTYSDVASHLASLELDVRNVKLDVEDAFQRFSVETSAATEAVAQFRKFAKELEKDMSATAFNSIIRVKEALRTAQDCLTSSEADSRQLSLNASVLEEELESAREALAAHASELCEFKDKYATLQKSADAERITFQTAVAEALNKLSVSDCRVSDLSLELQKTQEKCQMVEEESMVTIERMKAEAEVRKNAVQELENELKTLQDEVQSKENTCNALERELQDLVSNTTEVATTEASEVREAINSRSNDMDAAVLMVREEVERSRSELRAMENELQVLKDFRASTLVENATLKSTVRELECQLGNQETQMSEAEDSFKLRIEELEEQVLISQQRAEAADAIQAEEENQISGLLEEIRSKELVVNGLEFDMGLLQQSFTEVTAKHAKAQDCQSKLEKEVMRKSNDLLHVETLLLTVRKELSESDESLRLIEAEVHGLRDRNSSLRTENTVLTEKVQQLLLEKNDVQAELEEKCHLAESLDLELLELSSLVEQKITESMSSISQELNAVLRERDQLHADLLVATEQLEMVQSLADERDQVAIEARQVAEVSKAQAEEKDEEIKVLERSVGELESIVNALENQVGVVKREAQLQRITKEDLETEVQSLRHEISVRNGMIETQTMDVESVSQLKEEVARLNDDCSEKEAQIQAYTKHIGDLMTASKRQNAQYQQKITELETAIDQSKAKVKGSSSPFKCIGLGLSQQMNSEFDEELAAARKRIEELENIAASRQKEVHMLNSRLAEAETMTHDVVRDLLGVKVDISNYASLLSQEKTPASPKNQEEIGRLNKQLEAYIQEKESCLEIMNHRQAEIVAVHVAADKLRLREQTLTTENQKLKDEISAFKKVQQELESEVRKLSGQQNLQQRIHHHARIKEENTALRMKNEELSARLRQTETRLNRVSGELSRRK